MTDPTPAPEWRTALDALDAVARRSALVTLIGVTDRAIRQWRAGDTTPTEAHQRRLVDLAAYTVCGLAAELVREHG